MAVAAEVSGFELGCEAVLDIAGAALGHATAAVEAADAAKAAAEAAAAEKTRVLDVEWRRVFFWCNHLIEGKAHKKEAQVKDALAATDLTGAIYFGTPGIVAVEGTRLSFVPTDESLRLQDLQVHLSLLISSKKMPGRLVRRLSLKNRKDCQTRRPIGDLKR